MSVKRAIWSENPAIKCCAQCEGDIVEASKRNCRKCGEIFCRACTENKCFIPRDELVHNPVPASSSIMDVENEFRNQQHVCDECFYTLGDIQDDLAKELSRYCMLFSVLFAVLHLNFSPVAVKLWK